MTGKDERELLEELRRLYDDYERLNRRIQLATHRQHYSRDPEEVNRALVDEAKWLSEITRLMNRMRALEGQLLKARGKVRPLIH